MESALIIALILGPMSTLRTIDHMIDSGARQGRESNETNAASAVEHGELG